MLKKLAYIGMACFMWGALEAASAFNDLSLAIIGKNSPIALDIIKNRLHEIPDINQVDGYEQRTLLHYAAEHGMHDVVEALLNAGVRHDIRDDAGMYPVEIALNFRHIPTIEAILSHLRRVRSSELNTLLNVPNPTSRMTLLHSAILDGNLDAVRILVGQFGAQVTEEDVAEADNPTNGRPVNLELGSYLRQQRDQQQRGGFNRILGWFTGWGGSRG